MNKRSFLLHTTLGLCLLCPAASAADGPGHARLTYDPQLKEAVQQLKGTGVILWLTVQGKAANDANAVRIVREIADEEFPVHPSQVGRSKERSIH